MDLSRLSGNEYQPWRQISFFGGSGLVQRISANQATKKTESTFGLIALGFIILTALLHGFVLHSSAGRDDVHITYWSSKALVDFGGIVNLNGDFVEQSSSLLHVLILAAAYAITGIPLPTLGTALSIFFGVLATVATWTLAYRREIEWPWAAALFLAVFPYFVYWSFGALEPTLVALIVVLTMHSVHVLLVGGVSAARVSYALASIAAYILVRPEAIFVLLAFFIFVGMWALFFRWPAISSARERNYICLIVVSLLAASVFFFGLLAAWRIFTFGQIFPQPVYAKTSGLQIRTMIQGARYLLQQFEMLSLLALTIFAIASFFRDKAPEIKHRAALAHTILAAFTIAYLAFVVTAGGDHMEGGRFIVPILPLITILGLSALDQFSKRVRAGVVFTVVALAAMDTANFVRAKSTGTPIIFTEASYSPIFKDFDVSPEAFSWFEYTNRVHLRDVPFVDAMTKIIRQLIVTQEKEIVILSGQMGMVPFYLASEHYGEIAFIDRYGLATRHLTTCRITAELPRTRLGIFLTYEQFFEQFDDMKTECGLDRPDVIYDLTDPYNTQVIQENGYIIVYSQYGDITHQFGGGPVRADQFIAVRKNLFPLLSLGGYSPISYRWPDLSRADVRRHYDLP